MPSKEDYQAVAATLQTRLARKPFLTLTRSDVTEILRQVSGEPRTRIKILGSQAISDALAEMGLAFYPDLYDVGTHQALRLLRADSFLMELIGIINDPNPVNDARLSLALRGKTELAKPMRGNGKQLAEAAS